MVARRTIWTVGRLLAVGALAAGGLAVVAGPASAGDGCVTAKGGCGKVVDYTRPVTTCISWQGGGDDFTYPTTGSCAKTGKVGTDDTSTPTHDVDAIYIPKGVEFVGYGKSHSSLYPPPVLNCGSSMHWTHKGQGWWKFPNACTITLEYWEST